MASRIVLDTTPLSLLTHPNRALSDVQGVRQWLREQVSAGAQIYIPEIADYELRRELLRVGRTSSVRRLDALIVQLDYLAIDTATIRRAAELWASARQQGHITAPPEALDGDVILVAQAEMAGAVIATENPSHLAHFIIAKSWRDLPAGD